MRVRTVKDIGAAIKQARTHSGMSQTELAKKLGVSQPRISDIERGSTGVAIGEILKILAALDLATTLEHVRVHKRLHPSKRDAEFVDLDAIANTGLDPWPTKR